jgi:subtilisin family serine protease
MNRLVAGTLARQLWARGYTGKGVTVAHLDTGITGHHPALRGKVAAFRLFDDDGCLAASDRPVDTGVHGTHLAGIICGSEVEGKAIGLAPDAQVLSAAVINRGNNLERILGGLEWVLASKARILLLPFGTTTPNPALFSMIQTLRQAGVLVICPIGNKGAGRSTAPGNYANVLSVGAVDGQSRLASFSGSHLKQEVCFSPDLLAPGVKVLSAAAKSSGLMSHSGTSQAAAFVAGLAALLLQARPDATVDQLEYALAQSGRESEGEVCHYSRFGVINPLLALDALLEAPRDACLTPVLMPETARFVDPVLRRSIASANGDLLTCVFVAAEQDRPQPDRSAPGGIVAHLEQVMNEKAHRLRLFPDERTASVTASARFLLSLVDSDLVSVASAPRITTNPFA